MVVERRPRPGNFQNEQHLLFIAAPGSARPRPPACGRGLPTALSGAAMDDLKARPRRPDGGRLAVMQFDGDQPEL
jgi:hypothetical protein